MDKKEIKEYSKYRKQAKQGIFVYGGLLLLAIVGFWIIEHWIKIYVWFKYIVLVITAFSLISDLITYIKCGKKIEGGN